MRHTTFRYIFILIVCKKIGKSGFRLLNFICKLFIFAVMASKLKKKTKNSPEKTEKPNPKAFKAEKEEKIDWKSLARDERTRKITGTIFFLIAVFLFIAFVSYLFTWKEDQDIVFRGARILMDDDVKASNLLGRFGAYISHFFIYKGFGIASFLFCTFFFVVGVNLLFNKKVFSIWRNLKYVTVGLLVLSVILAFVFSNNAFRIGGGVGIMITDWLVRFLGNIGTAAVLFVVALGYVIWQFNPSFNLPQKQTMPANEETGAENIPVPPVVGSMINDLYAKKADKKGGLGKTNEPVLIINNDNEALHDFKIVERDDEEIEKMEEQQPTVEKEIVSEILHAHEEEQKIEPVIKDKPQRTAKEDLALEIKSVPDKPDEEKVYENLPAYEPT